jgi:hypothetical protein
MEKTVYIDYGTERRLGEKEKDSRYIQETSAPVKVSLYQVSDLIYVTGCSRNLGASEKTSILICLGLTAPLVVK